MADTLPAIKHLVRQTAVGIFAAALERRGANSCPEDPGTAPRAARGFIPATGAK